MIRLTSILLFSLLLGCSSFDAGRNVHYRREVILSRRIPENEFLKARLVTIAEDGTTTIQSMITGETLRAVPGAFFAPGPYGMRGLQLVSADAEKQEAVLLRRWSRSE